MNNQEQTATTRPEDDPTPQELRDRIRILEKVAAEPEKPWYKQASNLFSALAVVVTAAAVIQTQVELKNRELDDLQQIAVDIVENQKVVSELPTNPADAVLTSNLQGLLEEKGNTLASRGIELVKKHKGRIPPEIPFIVAYQALSTGHYKDAEWLYSRAINEADSSLSKSGPRSALAQLYFLPGTGIFSPDRGESSIKTTFGVWRTPTTQRLYILPVSSTRTGRRRSSKLEIRFRAFRNWQIQKKSTAPCLYRT